MQNAWKFVYIRKDCFRLTVKVTFDYAKCGAGLVHYTMFQHNDYCVIEQYLVI